MLWLIIARDGTDAEAPARRQAVRDRHLEGVRALAEEGRITYAGAMLDPEGTMIGSLVIAEADDEASARRLVESDVYTTAGVWQTYEIHPFRRAI